MIWREVLILCFAVFTVDVSAFHSRIIGGSDAYIEQFPYQVSLRDEDDDHFCGGSIISERHILTAAHCVTDSIFPYEDFYVVTGTSFENEDGNIHYIMNINVHPNYWTDDNRAVDDVAVITLKDAIIFNKYQQKINLPKDNPKVGQKANVTGWGLIEQTPTPVFPVLLQKLETEIISNKECQKKMIDPKKTEIYDTEICTAKESAVATCQGDSGGPLVSNGEVIGIVSWSDGDNCIGKAPDVFMNVFKYKDFIEFVMKNHE